MPPRRPRTTATRNVSLPRNSDEIVALLAQLNADPPLASGLDHNRTLFQNVLSTAEMAVREYVRQNYPDETPIDSDLMGQIVNMRRVTRAVAAAERAARYR